jgi:hypothetical protein
MGCLPDPNGSNVVAQPRVRNPSQAPTVEFMPSSELNSGRTLRDAFDPAA